MESIWNDAAQGTLNVLKITTITMTKCVYIETELGSERVQVSVYQALFP